MCIEKDKLNLSIAASNNFLKRQPLAFREENEEKELCANARNRWPFYLSLFIRPPGKQKKHLLEANVFEGRF